jgi:protein-S-isoprenylcysteine O-methyltransferase
MSSSGPKIDISLPVNRPVDNTKWTPALDATLRSKDASTSQFTTINSEFFPHGKRSLAGIAMRAFCLGTTAVLGFILSGLGIYFESRLWRPCLFFAILSIFHFLEFYITAAYNTPSAFVASFLLTNGDQYRLAHSMALVETVVTSYIAPSWQARVHSPVLIALGLGLVVMGQVVRSTAMAQAGTNFNHTVQKKKNDGHELVTSGLYAYFRHPSYFGFFWWGVGTQVMLGNVVCTLGYAGVLWYFFSRRIARKLVALTECGVVTDKLADEERHLIQFFGDDYTAYRARTRVWIPFI